MTYVWNRSSRNSCKYQSVNTYAPYNITLTLYNKITRWLSGVLGLWDRNKILRGGDLSHLHVPDCIWVFFYFVWLVFIHHNFEFYFELCTYCNILDIYLLYNLNYVYYLLLYMQLLNFVFCNMFGSVLECYELTGVSLLWPWLMKKK